MPIADPSGPNRPGTGAGRSRRPDPVRRSAARTATLIAVPIVLLIAVGSLWAFGGFSVFRSAPAPTPPPPAGATSPVSMPAPALPSAAVGVCRQVVAALPTSVLSRPRRPASGAEQNAAYGDPPLTLACGAPAVTVGPTEVVIQLSGVCWVARPGTSVAGGAMIWTTVDRAVPVQVAVPGAADGSAQSVIPFASAVKKNDPVASRYPTGCTG